MPVGQDRFHHRSVPVVPDRRGVDALNAKVINIFRKTAAMFASTAGTQHVADCGGRDGTDIRNLCVTESAQLQ